jgi:hypothetical protein
MASAKATLDLDASPEDVWQLIGGFGSIPDWVPGMSQSEFAEGGRVRHLHDPAGQTFVEQLENYDRRACRYSYSILQSPFAVNDYLATIVVSRGEHGGCHIEWHATFVPSAMSETEAETIFREIFAGGLKGLTTRFATSK